MARGPGPWVLVKDLKGTLKGCLKVSEGLGFRGLGFGAQGYKTLWGLGF